MKLWYLVPFLLAALNWFVQTRRHAESKNNWTWGSLGFCVGGVILGLIVFLDLAQLQANTPGGETERTRRKPESLPIFVSTPPQPWIRYLKDAFLAQGTARIAAHEITDFRADFIYTSGFKNPTPQFDWHMHAAAPYGIVAREAFLVSQDTTQFTLLRLRSQSPSDVVYVIPPAPKGSFVFTVALISAEEGKIRERVEDIVKSTPY